MPLGPGEDYVSMFQREWPGLLREDRPVGEIASTLGCREATVRVHLHRARKRLAGTLPPEVSYVP